jgi:hypothetical protein
MYQAALAFIILILLFYVSGYIGISGSDKLMLKWLCSICVFESRCENDNVETKSWGISVYICASKFSFSIFCHKIFALHTFCSIKGWRNSIFTYLDKNTPKAQGSIKYILMSFTPPSFQLARLDGWVAMLYQTTNFRKVGDGWEEF